MSVDSLEVRMARLEGSVLQISERLNAIDQRLADFDARLTGRIDSQGAELRSELHAFRAELLQRMDRQFYWVLSLIVVAILVPIFLRFVTL